MHVLKDRSERGIGWGAWWGDIELKIYDDDRWCVEYSHNGNVQARLYYVGAPDVDSLAEFLTYVVDYAIGMFAMTDEDYSIPLDELGLSERTYRAIGNVTRKAVD